MNLVKKEFTKTDKGWHRIAWAFLKVKNYIFRISE